MIVSGYQTEESIFGTRLSRIYTYIYIYAASPLFPPRTHPSVGSAVCVCVALYRADVQCQCHCDPLTKPPHLVTEAPRTRCNCRCCGPPLV